MTDFTSEFIEQYKDHIKEHSHYKVNNKTGCWEWFRAKTKGYGHFAIKGNFYLAHRFMWIINNGNIPDGLFVCHKCDNPCCINPDHLFLGTNIENLQDAINKGIKLGNSKGEKNGRSKLTQNQILNIKHLLHCKVPTKRIAEKFGISQRHVQYISNNKTWKHLLNKEI